MTQPAPIPATIPPDPTVRVCVDLPKSVVDQLGEYAEIQTHGSVGALCAELILEKVAPGLCRLGVMADG